MAFTVVYLSQQDPQWKNDKLGFGTGSQDTIGYVGCALTSVAMMLSGHGYPETPRTLNQKLKDRQGFVGSGIRWDVVYQVHPQVKLKANIRCEDADAPLGQIDAALDAGQAVVVRVDASPSPGLQWHYVLLYARKGDDYLMLDPWPYQPGTAREDLLMKRYRRRSGSSSSSSARCRPRATTSSPPSAPSRRRRRPSTAGWSSSRRRSAIKRQETELGGRGAAVRQRAGELTALIREQTSRRERGAGLHASDARAQLEPSIENEARAEATRLVAEVRDNAQRNAEREARKILTLAIQRYAGDQFSESSVSVVHLPSDDMKGRIIGREGRNIRLFETITGIEVIIDDTPEAVILSGFDPGPGRTGGR